MKKLINLSVLVLVFCFANAIVLSAYANKADLKSKSFFCGEKCAKKCEHKKCIEANKACDAGNKCCASKAEGKDAKNCAHASGDKKGKCCAHKKTESSEESKPTNQ